MVIPKKRRSASRGASLRRARLTSAQRYNAPALENGLSILEVVSKAPTPIKTDEIAAAVGRSRNKIYRMLLVLERQGYIARDGLGYRATNKLFSLGMHTPPIRDLTAAALPEMAELAETLGHSVHLVVPSNEDVVVIARFDSPAAFGFTISLGYRRPLLVATSGLVLFAFLTPERQAQWLQSLRHTAATNVDLDAFLREARQVRKDGWVARPSTTVEGVIDICAPIWSAESENCVANLLVPYMGIIGQKCTMDDAARRCRAAADRITARLRPHLRPGP